MPSYPLGEPSISPSTIGLPTINLFAAGNERASTAQRADQVRKRLLKALQIAEPAATFEENLLIGKWLDARHSRVWPGDSSPAASQGKDLDFA